jgi:hypothetical protein
MLATAKVALAVTTLAVGLMASPFAHADEYDFISDIDGRGVYYDDMLDMMDTGKLACATLRRGGNTQAVVGITRYLMNEKGFSAQESVIIVTSAAKHMCPDTLALLRTATAGAAPAGFSASITGTCDQQGKCYGVKQRTEPKNDAPQLVPDILDEGASVQIVCQSIGELKTETDHAPSNLWYRFTNGAYINSIYITPPGGAIPRCR